MVKVFPAPVWPYAKMVPLYPCMQLSAMGLAIWLNMVCYSMSSCPTKSKWNFLTSNPRSNKMVPFSTCTHFALPVPLFCSLSFNGRTLTTTLTLSWELLESKIFYSVSTDYNIDEDRSLVGLISDWSSANVSLLKLESLMLLVIMVLLKWIRSCACSVWYYWWSMLLCPPAAWVADLCIELLNYDLVA